MAESALLAHFLAGEREEREEDAKESSRKRQREEEEAHEPEHKRTHHDAQEQDANAQPHHQDQHQQHHQRGQQQQAGARSEGGDTDEEAPHLPRSTSRAAVKKGTECPYLDTVSRHNLDFDFEKCCSVTLSHINVYVCLVCGKYYQGRSLHTQAYTHSLETGHHMFMKLENGKVYCLPDNYEVVDRSLDDVRHVLDPRFTPNDVAKLDKDVTWARSLDGTEYMPGLVGLNNMKCHDYANVTIQIMARIPPIRDYFLIPDNYKSCKTLLVTRCGELLRKIWNTRNFKGQVSPHEFMQAVILASKKRFTLDHQSDPVEFASWLLNALHSDLTGGKLKKQSIITQCFQGELEVTTEKGTGKGKAATSPTDVVERMPFLLLGLDLPPAPLFKDTLEKNIIPQVPIFNIMRKFDGTTVTDDIRAGRRKFRITRLPKFLCLHMKRFTKNNFFVEKNPTIVNFPVKNMELRDILPVPDGTPSSKYDLVANVVHDGRAGEGTYRVHIHRKAEEVWYEVQDLRVIDILPQMVALSEAYFQVYQLQPPASDAKPQQQPQQQPQPQQQQQQPGNSSAAPQAQR